jgi:hypothetical protein
MMGVVYFVVTLVTTLFAAISFADLLDKKG